AADPIFPVRALVPALALTTMNQAGEPRELEIGKVDIDMKVPRAPGDMFAAASSRWSLASVDRAARTATFTWNDEADPNEVAEGARKYLDSEVAAARLRHG